MGAWQNGLFGCFNNCGLCIITYFVPCLTAGQNAQAVGESCCVYGCLTILGPIGVYTRAKIRGKIREQKGIEGWFLHGLCPSLVSSYMRFDPGSTGSWSEWWRDGTRIGLAATSPPTSSRCLLQRN